MAAFDAPDGPLKGNGKLAVQVLTWTMRPRVLLKADRNALITERAPKTLTSNSRRIAPSSNASSGPGVKIPALLISSTRHYVRLSTSRAQLLTAASSVISQTVRVTVPLEACLRLATSSAERAVPNTR